ncbi:MAG: hypothetical protein LBT46_05390 [Planctomycetaceae bacterium]|jgi:hypothetical protein|nr:hypothetical protein [Planctomycetaceae bacterium]
MQYRLFLLLFLLLICVLLTGCSQNIKVEGQVAFPDGTPLDTGRVVFENDRFYYYGNLRKDGKFSAGVLKDGQGIPKGKYRVAVENAALYETDEKGREKITPLIAAQHTTTKTSGLEYDIQTRTTGISIIVEKPENIQPPTRRNQ